MKLDEFTAAYIECALWASTGDDDESLDIYGITDLSPAALDSIREDCAAFQAAHAADIGDKAEQAGHDFWLTRNHHGAGFWDGDWPHDVGRRLTDAAHVYGSCDLYVGDDGKIHVT